MISVPVIAGQLTTSLKYSSFGLIFTILFLTIGLSYPGFSQNMQRGTSQIGSTLMIGDSWEALGGGLDSYANAMVTLGDYLYVAGSFDNVDFQATHKMARYQYQTQTWEPIFGPDDEVTTMVIHEGEIFIGGFFQNVDGQPYHNLAIYTPGGGWDAPTDLPNGDVRAMVILGDYLYIGGIFDQIGALTAHGAARYHLASDQWETIGGVDGDFFGGAFGNGEISAMATDGTHLFLTGPFTVDLDGTDITGVIQYTPETNTWQGLGQGIDELTFPTTLAVHDGILYAGSGDMSSGPFGEIGSIELSTIGAFNYEAIDRASQEWVSFGDALDGAVSQLRVYNGRLFAIGTFATVNGNDEKGIAMYDFDSSSWSGFGGGISSFGFVGLGTAIGFADGKLYASGGFDTAGDLAANNIARWSADFGADDDNGGGDPGDGGGGGPVVITLTAPLNGSPSESVDPLFTWNAPIGVVVDYYILEIFDNEELNGFPFFMNFDAITVPSYQYGESMFDLPLPQNMTFYWRVSAFDDQDNLVAQSAEPFSFTTEGDPVLVAPTLVSPVAPEPSADNVSLTPTFVWSEVDGATGYTLTYYVTSDGPGTAIEIELDINDEDLEYADPNYSYTLPIANALLPETGYTWTVTATADGLDPETSVPATFTTMALPPSAFNLVSPTNMDTDVPRIPTFNWEQSDGAVTYTLQLSTTNNFDAPIYQKEFIGLGDDEVTVSFEYDGDDLSVFRTYYWQVLAVGPGGETPSGSWQFRTVFDREIALISPVDDTEFPSTNAAISADYIWPHIFSDADEGEGNYFYTIQPFIENVMVVSTGPSGEVDGENFKAKILGNLSHGFRHSWIVRGYGTYDGERTDEVQSDRLFFTIAPETPVINAPIANTELEAETVFRWFIHERISNWLGDGDITGKFEFQLLFNNDPDADPSVDADDGYHFLVDASTTSVFGDPDDHTFTLQQLIDSNNDVSLSDIFGAEDQTIYWRVRIHPVYEEFEQDRVTLWSALTPVFVPSGVAPITLVSPGTDDDDTPQLGTLRPTFVWETLEDVDNVFYHLEISKQPDFGTLFGTQQTTQQTQRKIDFTLDGNSTYYWQVKATVGEDGVEIIGQSPVRSFSIGNIPIELISLANGAENIGFDDVFEWYSNSPQFYFTLMTQVNNETKSLITLLSSDGTYSLSELIENREEVEGNSFFQNVSPDTEYTWLVSMLDESFNFLGSSEQRTFTTGDLGFVAPTLVSPVALDLSAGNVSLTPTFVWSAVNGATDYTLTYYANEGGPDSAVNVELSIDDEDLEYTEPNYSYIYPIANALQPATGYTWMVTATADGLGSVTSNPATFTTMVLPPVAILLNGPASVSAGQTSTIFTLTTVDNEGNPSAVAESTTFDLSSNSNGIVTFAPASPVTIPAGQSSVTFTYTDTQSGPKTITATWASGDANMDATVSDERQITVNTAITINPTRLVFTNIAQLIGIGGDFGVMTIELQDFASNPGTRTVTTTIFLTSNPSVGVTFRNEADDADITQIQIPAGESSASFKVKSSELGEKSITASSIGLTSATQILTVHPFTSGNGTVVNPYVITDVDMLQAMKGYGSSHFKLGNDIDASATKAWNSGAGFEPVDLSAGGSFDGDFNVIYDLYINRPNTNNVGLFSQGRKISNVGLVRVNITGKDNVGGLAGIYNDQNNELSNSFTTGSVSGNSAVGGLVGRLRPSSILNSYSRSSVSGNGNVGGLVGALEGGIRNSYSTGLVVAQSGSSGGIIGVNQRPVMANGVFNSFWDVITSRRPASPSGGTGKSTADMKKLSTFTDAGWDFENIWLISPLVNNGYPALQNVGANNPSEVLPPPVLNSPVESELITFSWKGDATAMFVFEIHDDKDVLESVGPAATRSEDFTLKLENAGLTLELPSGRFTDGVTYYWRVSTVVESTPRAYVTSETGEFTPKQTPGVITTVSPVANPPLNTISGITFTWEPDDHATSYQILVYESDASGDPDLENPILDHTFTPGSDGALSFTTGEVITFIYGKTYLWRVIGVNGTKFGQPNDFSRFSIQPARLVVKTFEPNQTNNVTFIPAPVVEILDGSNNVMSGMTPTVTLSASSGVTLNGQRSVVAVAGSASFGGISATGPLNVDHTLTFNAPGFVPVSKFFRLHATAAATSNAKSITVKFTVTSEFLATITDQLKKEVAKFYCNEMNLDTDACGRINVIFTSSAKQVASTANSETLDSNEGILPVFWGTPQDDEFIEFPITDFALQYRETGTEAWTMFTRTPSVDTLAIITGLKSNTSYDVRVAPINHHGVGQFTVPVDMETMELQEILDFIDEVAELISTSIEHEELPREYILSQNYPNPFNPTTTIRYALPEMAEVRLEVYNTLGQRLAVLVQGHQPAGWHSVQLDASRWASGTYFYRLQAGDRVMTKKLLLIK